MITNRRVLAPLLAVALAATACSTDNGSSPAAPSGAAPSAVASPASPASPAAPSPDASAPSVGSAEPSGPAEPGEGEFVNPVHDRPLADPFILEHEGTYYAYGTKAFEANQFETASSTDLVNWESLPSALRGLPSWSPGKAWAPEVFKIGDTFVMYYTASAPELDNPFGDPSQCITVAVGDSPAGPLVDESEEPLVCQPELGGSIDATYFKDTDGTQYLIWKNDGNCCSIPTRFYLQELSEDGLSLTGEVTELGIRNDRPWEGAVIEAPTLLEREGTYYMFYSGGNFASAGYAVGYATADNVKGPYKDSPENPILTSENPAAGPGHQTIIEDKDGDLWMAYHAWDVDRIGEQAGGQRRMWIDPMEFDGDIPVINGPNEGPQPIP